MAFSKLKLNKIGGMALKGNAPQVFTYDNKAGDTVTADNFFNPVADLLAVGDIIRVVNYTSTAASGLVDYVVASITAGVVVIAAGDAA